MRAILLLIAMTSVMKSWTTQAHGVSLDQAISAGVDIKADTPLQIGIDGRAYPYSQTKLSIWSSNFFPPGSYSGISPGFASEGNLFAYVYYDMNVRRPIIASAIQTISNTLYPPIATTQLGSSSVMPSMFSTTSTSIGGSIYFTTMVNYNNAALTLFTTQMDIAGNILGTTSFTPLTAAAGDFVTGGAIAWDQPASTLLMYYAEFNQADPSNAIRRVMSMYCAGGAPIPTTSVPVAIPDSPSANYSFSTQFAPLLPIGATSGVSRCAFTWLSGIVVGSYTASTPIASSAVDFTGSNLATNRGDAPPHDQSEFPNSLILQGNTIIVAWGNVLAPVPFALSMFTTAGNVATLTAQYQSTVNSYATTNQIVYDPTDDIIWCVGLSTSTFAMPFTTMAGFGAAALVTGDGQQTQPIYSAAKQATIVLGVYQGNSNTGYYLTTGFRSDPSRFAGLAYTSAAAGETIYIDMPGSVHALSAPILTPGQLVYITGATITQIPSLAAIIIGIATSTNQVVMSPQLPGIYAIPYSMSSLPLLAPGAIIYVYDYVSGPVLAFADDAGAWQRISYTLL